MKNILFLNIEEVIKIHAHQIALFGGLPGIRDYNLLESALYTPQSTFDGNYLHQDIFAMAAAYGFHLIKNHPFVDGNKRTGIICPVLFLEYNDYEIEISQKKLFDIAISLATSKLSINQFALFLKKNCPTH